MKQEVLDALEEMGDRLPPNTLDQLIDALGGTENVAEVRIISISIIESDFTMIYNIPQMWIYICNLQKVYSFPVFGFE